MNLDDFESSVPEKILVRGRDYYRDGAVRRFERYDADEYGALVYGTSRYSVSFTLRGREVSAWRCSCPYDWGDTCKHVVAVMYALRANRPQLPAGETLRQLLARVNTTEFLFQHLKSDWPLRREFLETFMGEEFEDDEYDDLEEDYY
jgi:uncharacterized Zn finger protein